MKSFLGSIMALVIGFTVLTGCNFGSSGKNTSSTSTSNETGSSAAPTLPKQILNMIEGDEISTLDTAKDMNAISANAMNSLYEGLFRYNDKDQPELALAEKHEASEDGLTHTFTLRDAKWSNGDPVTAHDFEYGWKRVAKENGPYISLFELAALLNVTKIMNGEMKPDDLGVKAIDDKTLEVKLSAPSPMLEMLMALPIFAPQNEKFVTQAGEKYGLEYDKVLSNGPFVMTEWKHNQSWQYKKNEQYWDAEHVKLEEVNVFVVKEGSAAVNLFETEKVDRAVYLSPSDVAGYEGSEHLIKMATTSNSFIRLNPDFAPFKNENIRRAISMAMDRESLTSIILNDGTIPSYGIVPAHFSLSPDNKYFREANGELSKGTKEEAQALWQKGLAEIGQTKVEPTLIFSDEDWSKKTAEFLKAQLEKDLPGFTLKLETVPFDQRITREKAFDYEMTLSTWGADYNDPTAFLDMWVTGRAANRMKYSNPAYDELLAKSNVETDPKKRYDMLLELEKMLIKDDAAFVPLMQFGNLILKRSNVKGMIEHYSGIEYSLKWAYIE
ncbi:hypothetical protein VN24_22275 [Paenibacillus beijingensis]|uniref:Solute-binding protein family 5 domain-containing protein n=2 Tax=Paenibacillus beijingensis TaxID=1126833 RepID=A0A0D5NSQ2_9BACL|nr:hypothetical protein VN24_22275 [Paenibacillus beijingensis]